jgi:hypothetical protein
MRLFWKEKDVEVVAIRFQDFDEGGSGRREEESGGARIYAINLLSQFEGLFSSLVAKKTSYMRGGGISEEAKAPEHAHLRDAF